VPQRLKTNGRNVQWERRVLDCVIIEPSLWPRIADLRREDFLLPTNWLVFSAIRKLNAANEPTSLVNIGDCVGQEHIVTFTSDEPIPRSAPKEINNYIDKLRTESAVRRTTSAMQQMVADVTEGDGVALDDIRKLINSLPALGANGASTTIHLESYKSIQKEHLHAMWPGYLPLSRLVHLAGDSGEGKSPLTIDLTARVTSALNWPDGTPNSLGPRSVILLASEDDTRDTVRPRLELSGADLSRVYDVRCSVAEGQDRHEILLALDRDVHQLVARAREIPDLAFMVIDPISNYLGTVQMRLEEEVRSRLLMPLSAAAADLGICVFTVGHLNRRERGTSPLQRIMGAAAFHGVARYIYFVGADPDDDDKHAHVLVQQRGGNSPSLRYRTVARPMTWDGETSEVVQIEWRGASEATSQDAVDPQRADDKSATDKAASALVEILKNGRVPAVDAKQLLKDAGHDVDKLNWTRVHRKAGAKSERFHGERYFSWFLSTTQTP
jgi:hypothetical protein